MDARQIIIRITLTTCSPMCRSSGIWETWQQFDAKRIYAHCRGPLQGESCGIAAVLSPGAGYSLDCQSPATDLHICEGGSEIAAHVVELGFAHRVIELPNIGQEQEIYLQHLVLHYEDLPGHTFFTQALPNFDSTSVAF